MSLGKRQSCEYRHCKSVWQESQSLWIAARCLDKSSIKTSWASLPAKQAITVGFSSGFNVKLLNDWTNFDLQKLCQSVEHICLTPESCLSLTNTRQDTSQQVTQYGSANQEFADTSLRRNEQMEVLIEGVPYPLSPTPLPFPFLRIPYPFQRLLRRLETSGVSWFSHGVTKFKLGNYLFFWVSAFIRYYSTLKPSYKQIFGSKGFFVLRYRAIEFPLAFAWRGLADSQESSFGGWKN